ncbi:MAG: hypothetical protein ACMUJM_07395 [bacterium]
MVIVFSLISCALFSKASAFEIHATLSGGYESNPALDPNDEESSSLAIYALEMDKVFSLPSSFEGDLVFAGLYKDYFKCGDTFQGSASFGLRRSFFLQRLIPSLIFTSEICRDKIRRENEKDSFAVDFGAHYIPSPQLMVGVFSAWTWENDADLSDDSQASFVGRQFQGGHSSTGTGTDSYSSYSSADDYIHTLSFSLNFQPTRFFYIDFMYKNNRFSSQEYTSDEFIVSPTFIAPKDITISMTASLVEYLYHKALESNYLRPEQERFLSMTMEKSFGWITPYILISWVEGDLVSSVAQKYYHNEVGECGISVLF